MIQDYLDYRDFVRDFIAGIKKKNPSFSMRALAKKADISAAQLSMVLSRSKHLSSKQAKDLGKALNLKLADLDYFLLLVESSRGEAGVKEAILKKIHIERGKKIIQNEEVSKDAAFLTWEHLFVLVLNDASADRSLVVSSACALLKKTEAQVEGIIEDLLKHGLLKEQDRQLIKSKKKIAFTSSEDNSVLKKLHHDYLIASDQFLHQNTRDQRYSVTEFIRIPKSGMDKAVQLTNEYLDELSSLASGSESETEMMGISLHLNRFV